jgi:excisionase family DNA binding protein
MKHRSITTTELTPEARIDAARRAIANAIDELIEAKIAMGVASSEWVDQMTSPLGKRRHLRLVREGVLQAVKDGRRRLVRRSDINAYLESQPVRTPPKREDDVDEMMLRIVGGHR